VDGRAQARRVRAHADLPRARRRPQDAGEEALMATVEAPQLEARAEARWVRTAPRKAQLVVREIRNLRVGEALTVLSFMTKAAARDVEAVLKSAIANAEANHG